MARQQDPDWQAMRMKGGKTTWSRYCKGLLTAHQAASMVLLWQQNNILISNFTLCT